MDTKRIVLNGSGGQGVVTVAIILAEAAALKRPGKGDEALCRFFLSEKILN